MEIFAYLTGQFLVDILTLSTKVFIYGCVGGIVLYLIILFAMRYFNKYNTRNWWFITTSFFAVPYLIVLMTIGSSLYVVKTSIVVDAYEYSMSMARKIDDAKNTIMGAAIEAVNDGVDQAVSHVTGNESPEAESDIEQMGKQVVKAGANSAVKATINKYLDESPITIMLEKFPIIGHFLEDYNIHGKNAVEIVDSVFENINDYINSLLVIVLKWLLIYIIPWCGISIYIGHKKAKRKRRLAELGYVPQTIWQRIGGWFVGLWHSSLGLWGKTMEKIGSKDGEDADGKLIAGSDTKLLAPPRHKKNVNAEADDAEFEVVDEPNEEVQQETLSEKTNKIAQKTAEKTGQIAQKTAEKTGQIAQKTAEKTSKIAEKTGKKSKELFGKLKKQIDNGVNKVKESSASAAPVAVPVATPVEEVVEAVPVAVPEAAEAPVAEPVAAPVEEVVEAVPVAVPEAAEAPVAEPVAEPVKAEPVEEVVEAVPVAVPVAAEAPKAEPKAEQKPAPKAEPVKEEVDIASIELPEDDDEPKTETIAQKTGKIAQKTGKKSKELFGKLKTQIDNGITKIKESEAAPVATPVQATPVQAAPVAAPVQATPVQAAPVATPVQATPVQAAPVATPVQATPVQAAPVATPVQAAPVATPVQAAPVAAPVQATPVATPVQATPVQAAPVAAPVVEAIPVASPETPPIPESPNNQNDK